MDAGALTKLTDVDTLRCLILDQADAIIAQQRYIDVGEAISAQHDAAIASRVRSIAYKEAKVAALTGGIGPGAVFLTRSPADSCRDFGASDFG